MWTVTFLNDTSDPFVGTVIATCGSTTLSRRVNTRLIEDMDEFVAHCHAEQAKAEATALACAEVAARMANLLNQEVAP